MACPFACALKGPVVVHLKGKEVKWRKGSYDCRMVKPCWISVVNWERAIRFTCTSSINTGLTLVELYIRLYFEGSRLLRQGGYRRSCCSRGFGRQQDEAEDEVKSRRCRAAGVI